MGSRCEWVSRFAAPERPRKRRKKKRVERKKSKNKRQVSGETESQKEKRLEIAKNGVLGQPSDLIRRVRLKQMRDENSAFIRSEKNLLPCFLLLGRTYVHGWMHLSVRRFEYPCNMYIWSMACM